MPLTGSTFIFGQSGEGSGGGGTSPGGSPTQLQFNNTVFGGVPGSTVDASTGEITLTTVTGIVLNIIQQDMSSNAVQVGDGLGDLFQIFTQDGATAFNLADSTGGTITLQSTSGVPFLSLEDSTLNTVYISPDSLGFFNATPVAKQTVTGAKLPSDTVMASLLAALAAYGLIIDSTT